MTEASYELCYSPREGDVLIYRNIRAGVCGPFTEPHPCDSREAAERFAAERGYRIAGEWKSGVNYDGVDLIRAEVRMAEFPINHQMPNGVTVADWLGTAASAARAAAMHIEDVRGSRFEHRPDAFTSRAKLRKATEQLRQALSELETVSGVLEIERTKQ